MADFFKTPKTKTLLRTLCGILILLVVFGLGIAVGYRRAIFASNFGEKYYENFYGDPFGKPMIGVMGRGPVTMHGVAGEVIDVSSGTISVKDPMGNEASIVITSATPIREMNNNIGADAIEIGNTVTVIGEPNGNGQVQAKFVRVFLTNAQK